ncbi:MAG TPA: monovalent cation/H(+) antiporter subunit G, partial [Pseudogracilibacillus sp.]|nr:monovalent cation/H(+) antiporter subunit G [Pseudogracilibacillus sp.]
MSVNEIFEWIEAIIILIGSIISVISAVGIIRFHDIYSRAHAATKTTTLAVLITLVGTFIYAWLGEGHISVRLMLGIVFVFITAPVSGHLVLRAAYRANVKMAD